jgi:hypothetical protein
MMKEESTNHWDRQAVKTTYVAVPTADLEVEMKTSMNDQSSSQARKMRLLTILLLLGMFSFFVHKVIFYHHVANVFHFMNHGQPCHHHVRFTPSPNDDRHPHMQKNSITPPKMYQPPGRDGNDSVQHEIHMNMGMPEMQSHHGHFNHDHDKHYHHAHSKSVDEGKDLDVWERIADMWNGGTDLKVESSDSSDSSDNEDVWERIADVWKRGTDHKVESLDSSDDTEDKDVWERIADKWNGSEHHMRESSDSSDDNEDEDVWERIANMWKAIPKQNYRQDEVFSNDEKK